MTDDVELRAGPFVDETDRADYWFHMWEKERDRVELANKNNAFLHQLIEKLNEED